MARLPFRAPSPLRWGRRLVDLLGPTGSAARQSLTALFFNSSTSLIAGALLGAIVGTFEDLPGLLVMVPAAIGLRGNIFGTFGNRISTSVHAGTFSTSLRRDSVLGQNVLAAGALTLVMSTVLALVAQLVSVAFGLEATIDVFDMVFISVAGGVLASLVVLGATALLSVLAVRRNWDLDNLVAPTVSTLGDVITIPCLWAVALLVGGGAWIDVVSTVLIAASVVVLVLGVRSHLDDMRRIVIESIPVLGVALVLSTLAGMALQKRVELLALVPALLVLQPAFVSSAGALGGILSSRISTKLHLGLIRPTMAPELEVQRDALLVMVVGLPVYVFNGLGAQLVASVLGQASPGVWQMLTVSLIGGVLTMLFMMALAYYGTIAAWRVDVDPDSVGIPVVTASVDFVGVVLLMAVAVAIGAV